MRVSPFARAGLALPNNRLAVLPRSVARFYINAGLIAELGVELDGYVGRYGLLIPNMDEPDPNVEALVRYIQTVVG